MHRPCVRDYYLGYLPALVEVIRAHYKPEDQFVSSRNVAAYIMDDPVYHQKFNHLGQVELRKICSYLIRAHLNGSVINASKNRSFLLPHPVSELEASLCASA